MEVIFGEEEALFGYTGAMQELHLSGGAFMDIGGVSTEVVTFDDGEPVDFASFPIGSLSLYRHCIKKILPGEGSLKRLKHEIANTIDERKDVLAPHSLVVGVGGTARAALKLARHYYNISKDCRNMLVNKLDGKYSRLCVSPFGIKSMLLQNIDKQIALGKNGYICIKANSVTEREVIDKPAEASCAVWKLPVLCRIWSCGSSLNGCWICSCVILQRQA